MTDKKRRFTSAVVTVILHLAVLILMMFITLKISADRELEDGVPVLLGNVEDAAGEDLGGIPDDAAEETDAAEEESVDETSVEDVPEPKETVKPAQSSSTSQITQENERSIAAERAKAEAAEKARREAEAKRKAELEAKAKAEAAEKARREAEAKRKAEAEAKAKANVNSRVSGAFGKNGNNSGNTQGSGNQGSPTGNSNTGNVNGVGGTGNASANVGSRTVKVLAKPNYSDRTSEGTVIVSITVNAQGRVIQAAIKSSTTTSPRLQQSALSAARNSTFSIGESNENGTITYVFKQK